MVTQIRNYSGETLSFYTPKFAHRLDIVTETIYEQTCEDAGYSLEADQQCDAVMYGELLDSMFDAYLHEVVLKQAEEGSLNTYFTQEEAILAMENDNEYFSLQEQIADFLSYNDSFGVHRYGAEEDFLNDVTKKLSEWQLFYVKGVPDDDQLIDESDTYRIGDGMYSVLISAVNSPLQEVW